MKLRFAAWLQRLREPREAGPLWIRLEREFGRFPNDQAKATELSATEIAAALQANRMIVLDLDKVDVVTQSFFNNLLSPAFAERPHRVSRLFVANASEPNLAALELAVTFLVRTHNRSRDEINPRVRRYEDRAVSRTQ